MKRLLIIPALAITMAACGGNPNTDYIRTVNDTITETGNSIAALSSSVDEAAPRDSDAAVYDEQASELTQLAGKLSTIEKVPDSLKNAHTELVDAINATAQDVDSAESSSAEDFARKLEIDSKRVQTAITTINGKV